MKRILLGLCIVMTVGGMIWLGIRVTPEEVLVQNADFSAFKASRTADFSTLSTKDMLLYALENEEYAIHLYEGAIQEYGEIRPFANRLPSKLKRKFYIENVMEELGIQKPKSLDDLVAPTGLSKELYEAETEEFEVYNRDMYKIFLQNTAPDQVHELFEELFEGSLS